MAQPDTSQEPARRPGRLVSAWRVLMGRALTPDQIVAEWIEYKQTFNDVLSKFSALLARQAKAEKDRIRRELEECSDCPDEETAGIPVSNREALKAELRRNMVGRTAPELVEATKQRRGA